MVILFEHIFYVPLSVGMVQHNQFLGLLTENSNLHLSIFVEFCSTLRYNGIVQNAIRLRLSMALIFACKFHNYVTTTKGYFPYTVLSAKKNNPSEK